ncbi:hypothetical protein Vadar_007923 [Vaccinium darrowii]|uniref:Uncharacterized protein n=1 Tax=Vaccinium darrowii TaxID=229202 RepID=A0ACB7XPD1_9ERIC|nr:hypothetical protein Vadar_007923 [Vaccinium darrowii]
MESQMGKTAMSVVFTSQGLLSFATPAISPSTSPASNYPLKFTIHFTPITLSLYQIHPLRLPSTIFFCELYRNIRDCYSYSCAQCHFALNSHCALSIPTSIQHLSHHHPLDLVTNERINYPYPNQKTITKSKAYYECTMPGCKQILGFNLAFLPPTGKHKVHRHQLRLTFLPLTELRPEEPISDPHGEFRPETVEEYYCDAPKESTLATLSIPRTSTIVVLVKNYGGVMDCSTAAKSATLLVIRLVLHHTDSKFLSQTSSHWPHSKIKVTTMFLPSRQTLP